jgi:diguanylate cyclase (GGDEF)-like protein
MNRRSFMERAAYELEAAVGRRMPSGIVMMDVDHFKEFNDTWGHQAGDAALRHIVQISSSLLRKGDFLGRYGGEEFTFFFGNADRKTGIAIAERVRKAIKKNPVEVGDDPLVITASFGVAMIEDLSPDDAGGMNGNALLELLIHNADTALYEAKQGGRNRVVAYEAAPLWKVK